MSMKPPLPSRTPTEVLFLASNTLSDVAFKSAQDSKTTPDSHLIALLFSAAWFEAVLNELIWDITQSGHGGEHANVHQAGQIAIAAGLDEKMAPVRRKLRVLCAAMTGSDLDHLSAPWRDLFLLFSLRNWIVHLRPEMLPVRPGADDEPSSLVSSKVHEFVTALHEAGAIAEIPSGRMVPVTLATCLPGVGAWAYRTAHKALAGVHAWFPTIRGRMSALYRDPALLDGAG